MISNNQFLENVKENNIKAKNRGFKNLFESFECKTPKEIYSFSNVILLGSIDNQVLFSIDDYNKRLKKNNTIRNKKPNSNHKSLV